MSFVETIRQWDKAVAYLDQGDSGAAMTVFLDIQDKNSKIYFNIGCLHLNKKEFDAAERAFDCSIRKDEHLAVAFFQRGITFYKKEKFEESLADFQHCFKKFRGNQLIDYNPLGLRYKLYAWEVLHNTALSYARLNEWEKAQEKLLVALELKTEAKCCRIDCALQSILKQKLFELVELPPTTVFKPNKSYVAELEKKDYLGKAKVVASIVHKDDFSGFAPLQPQVEEIPDRPKAPEVLRALQGVPYTVLYEFVPETSEELAVVPGNIVFVVHKGTDNWASVIFNERKGLVPYNFLQRLEITLPSRYDQTILDGGNDDIPAPPRREPPRTPERSTGLSPEKNNFRPEVESSENALCILKVHFTYTIAIRTSPSLPFQTLLEILSNKLCLPVAAMTLSYAQKGSDETVKVEESVMEEIWRSMRKDRLTLFCEIKKDHSVALYSYKASNPEDLEFQQGDVITLISKVNEDWFEGESNGKTGIFPAAFVQVPAKDKCDQTITSY